MAIRPPMIYFGGKQNIAECIAALLPPHGHYVEPYCGSLSVLLAKRPSKMETVNDLDEDLMTFWRVLRDRPAELERVCALTPHSRAEHMRSWDMGTTDDIERARRVWVLLTQGRSGTLRDAKTGWRYYVDTHGTGATMPEYLDGYLARMASVAKRLHGISLECRPALDVIGLYGRQSDVLFYVDPPYLGTTRGLGLNYKHEMKSEEEHRELASTLRAARAAVVLSGYSSDLYDHELYADWFRIEIPALTGNGRDQARTEVLWSNRLFTRQGVLQFGP